MTSWFVTRHPGAVDWAQARGIDAQLLAHLDPSTVGPGDIVMGTLPVPLAAAVCERGACYLHLSLDIPADLRGQELSARQMDQLGATLEEFTARKLDRG